MSLVQYLALGKSIENVSGEGRYKVADESVVPNFSRGTPLNRPAAEVREARPAVLPAPVKAAPAEVRPAPVAVKPARPLRAAKRKGILAELGLRRMPEQDRQAIAVQRELALEAVRPVRNDLNESDLEVVPKPAPQAAEVQAGLRGRVMRWLRSRWPFRR